jgi:diguanylate cyclase (GGDEF)-like protein
LGLRKESIGLTFNLNDYINHRPLYDFVEDPNRSSFIENEISSSIFNDTEQWFAMSCCKIDFLGTPSVMFNLHDITALKLREKDLTITSNTDPLTGLLNRRGFYSKALTTIEQCKRSNQSLSLAMCDLDFFKKLNDNYGHDFGDDILQLFSKVCNDTFRQVDIKARFGGEEFVILLVNIDFPEAINVVDRMRENWQKAAFEVNGTQCKSTVSIGITQINLDYADLTDDYIDEAIKRADKLLYKCKELGRNTVEH